jgi:DNA-binding response OmpR family regulator
LKAIHKILIVDDDQSVIRSLTDYCYACLPDVALFTASDPRAGFAKYFSSAPDLVFLDVHFPGDEVGGIKLLKRIRNVPMVVFVPFVVFSDRETVGAQLAGDSRVTPDDFLSKPISETEFIAKIRQWDRIMYAERALAMRNEQLTRKSEDLADQNIDAMQQISDQHNVATLGLFTRGLITVLTDIVSASTGYAELYKRHADNPRMRGAIVERMMHVIEENAEKDSALLAALKLFFGRENDEPDAESIVPMLNALAVLVRPELRRRGLEIVISFVPVDKCIAVPSMFISTVLSILLFYRDAGISGSIISVTTKQQGSMVEADFSGQIRKEVIDRLGIADPDNKNAGFPAAESPHASTHALHRAIEQAKQMQGGIECSVVGTNLRITLSLVTEAGMQELAF